MAYDRGHRGLFESVLETLLFGLPLGHNIRYHLRYLRDKNRGPRAEKKRLGLLFSYFAQTSRSVKEEAKLKWISMKIGWQVTAL